MRNTGAAATFSFTTCTTTTITFRCQKNNINQYYHLQLFSLLLEMILLLPRLNLNRKNKTIYGKLLIYFCDLIISENPSCNCPTCVPWATTVVGVCNLNFTFGLHFSVVHPSLQWLLLLLLSLRAILSALLLLLSIIPPIQLFAITDQHNTKNLYSLLSFKTFLNLQ